MKKKSSKPKAQKHAELATQKIRDEWQNIIDLWGYEGKNGFAFLKTSFSNGAYYEYLLYRNGGVLLACAGFDTKNNVRILLDSNQVGPTTCQFVLEKAQSVWELDENCVYSVIYHDFPEPEII
jgi:hypothetical protein